MKYAQVIFACWRFARYRNPSFLVNGMISQLWFVQLLNFDLHKIETTKNLSMTLRCKATSCQRCDLLIDTPAHCERADARNEPAQMTRVLARPQLILHLVWWPSLLLEQIHYLVLSLLDVIFRHHHPPHGHAYSCCQ